MSAVFECDSDFIFPGHVVLGKSPHRMVPQFPHPLMAKQYCFIGLL